MPVTYRLTAYEEADYEGVVRIERIIDPDGFETPEDMAEFDAMQKKAGRLSSRWHAFDNDTLVGSSYMGAMPWFPEHLLWTFVAVHPEYQRRGIGTSLLARVEDVAADRGYAQVLTVAEERQPRSMRFLEAAGYQEVERAWRSTLDLTTWDRRPWQPVVRRMLDAGIDVKSVAELAADGDEWLSALHDLYVTAEQDIPSYVEIRGTPLADFEAMAITSHRAIPEAYLIAIDDDEFVGLTQPQRVADRPTALSQELTATRASHRGRGIATGLKALALQWAQDNGFEQVRTYNAQSNAPMLAVNTKLGFERDHADVMYLKGLPT